MARARNTAGSGPDAEPREIDVVVVGAGASGIGAAIRLLRENITDFVVLEKAGDLGGTWRDNTYPGCACDVPSALYSYSFAPNPGWSRVFATQPEIRTYLRDVAERHGVGRYTRFGAEVTDARWEEAAGRWRVSSTTGEFRARVLIAGAGPWHEPRIPEIDGLAGFPGAVFHSSRWAHDVDLTGKRVAVVGTGASAVQFVPEIQPEVASLHLFQRTAQWVLPKPDRELTEAERWVLRRVPGAQRALRAAEYGLMEALGVGFRHPWILRLVQRVGLWHLRRTVRDAGLRAALTPNYTLGCKRLLMSNTYYPALARPNVRVHPTALREVRGSTVVGADGSRAEVDAIIFGTGFHMLDMPVAEKVFDGHGRSLAERWQGSPQAYLGTTVSGFPNAFLLLGPSLGTGHSSAFTILEAQLDYMIDSVRRILGNGWSSVDVRPEVQDRFNAEVQRALQGTVYNAGGCSSYYLDANGRNSFNWPWSTPRLRRTIRAFDPADYTIRHRDTTGAAR
ncbi:Predicted flavoprotein CzcO associated with the cation diffusion facilitator CzcD [Haloechinothrix alba]|uniref:Predicted flavoprotein CzcO associated with the cation diffusion facilitator CzcD n=1 Tax=Haloechinothrix alba TaxID=664784 RepID=A0A238WNT4_9PSEU|nr:NAD(P)/FAD-dependent oxidoreductase [Haloechinothrix alba]SNR48078.1 Predicted flavoprotein CzcO associated with the cation diffusion facilitator CzcD [Haloechinothrix alba]